MEHNHRTGGLPQLHASCSFLQTEPGPSTPTVQHTSPTCNQSLEETSQLPGPVVLSPTSGTLDQANEGANTACSTVTLPVLARQREDTLQLVWRSLTVIAPHPPIAACRLYKNKRETVWDLKASLHAKKKLTNFDFKHLYCRFNIMLVVLLLCK